MVDDMDLSVATYFATMRQNYFDVGFSRKNMLKSWDDELEADDALESVDLCFCRDEDKSANPVVPPIRALPSIEGRLQPLQPEFLKATISLMVEVESHMPRVIQCVDLFRNKCGFCEGPRTLIFAQCTKCFKVACESCMNAGVQHDLSRVVDFSSVCLPLHSRYCDECGTTIQPGSSFWTTHANLHCVVEDSVDICTECKAKDGIEVSFPEIESMVPCTWPDVVGANEALGVGRFVDWIPVACTVATDGSHKYWHAGLLGTVLVHTNPTSPYKTALMYRRVFARYGENDSKTSCVVFCASTADLDQVLAAITDDICVVSGTDTDTDTDDGVSVKGCVDFDALARKLGFFPAATDTLCET